MRKFVSPRNKHKVLQAPNKTFGVPLDELIRQVPGDQEPVPAPVKKICEHIFRHGVDQEGIFRVSGSARVVDKLKTAFNVSGDADLEADGDIMAVAGLLKLFLRELPDSVVPEHLTQEFIAIQNGTSDKQEYLLRLRSRLLSLPEENYTLLKYIMCFLVAVSCYHDVNKMGPMPLAIVFGPNIFRCGDGIAGLKDQGNINMIVSEFISSYNQVFREENEPEAVDIWKQKMKKIPPPRPPPPQVMLTNSSSPSPVTVEQEFKPVPAPRKQKQAQYDSSQYQDIDDTDKSETTTSIRSSHRGHSPHFSDEESVSHGRVSPFILESESHSIIESPMVTARTSEIVERTICDTITERLFGSDISSARGSPSTKSTDSGSPEQRLEDTMASVRCRVELFEKRNSLSDDPQPSSSQSGVCSSASWQTSQTRGDSSVGDLAQKGGGDGALSNALDDEFVGLPRDTEILGSVKKDGGPARRSPSAKFRRSESPEKTEEVEKKEVDEELTDLLEETAIVVTGGSFQTHKWSKMTEQDKSEGKKDDINHNHQAKQIKLGFLNIHENQENVPIGGDKPSPERSPLTRHKLGIPPLDFSTLHETVDGSAPILASNSQTGSWDRKLKVQQEDTNGIPSPRSMKMKKRNGSPNNTDVPPSPPKYQDHAYQKTLVDEDYSHSYKQLTKKIQGYKRKIKAFEDEFEQEHGYKPSQGEKAARPEIKKSMTDLSRARKDLKRLKEECERGNRSRHGSGASSSGDGLDTPKVAETLDVIVISLKEKRQDASRPEDITLMSREQVQEEKLAVQKALLHFEGLHGRPTSKEDKDVMRPLYDRYRAIKRMLAKPVSPRNSLDLHLPTVPEDQMMEIPSVSALFQRNPVRVPTGEEEDTGDTLGTMDFAVTRDFSAMKDTVFPASFGGSPWGTVQPKVRKKDSEEDEDQNPSAESNLHELGIQELHEELESSKGEKKKLRHHLREFEKSFHEKHGRKVQKEDRAPMQDHYDQYKQVKARLRLLEALVLKHQE